MVQLEMDDKTPNAPNDVGPTFLKGYVSMLGNRGV